MINKYLLGSPEDFNNFVDGIYEKNKIKIITHVDLDGIASGIFLQKILESKKLKIDSINFLNYGADVLKDFAEKNDYDFLFFTDWCVDNYPEDLELLRKKGKVFIIDHHPVNKFLEDKSGIIKTDSGYCSSHCLFDLGKKYFDTKKWEWLVCSAIISDYTWNKFDNFEFIKKIYPEVKKDSTIWESEPALNGNKISGALVYYRPDFKKVYDLVLEKNLNELEKASEIIREETSRWIEKYKKEAEYFPDEKLRFYYGLPKYGTSTVASIVSDKYFPNNIIIFASDVTDKKDFIKISSRTQLEDVDLGELLKKCIKGFENSDAGGHRKASAATFPKKYLEKFKENLLKELKK